MTGLLVAERGRVRRPHMVRGNRLAALAPRLPLLAIVGTAFVGTALWVRSIHTFSVMPDELGYVKQSLQIAHTGLPVGSHSFFFNSWGQLLPAISAPIFGAMGMVDAFYTAHTLYALLLASTAIPAYLLAREVGLDRWAANVAALLSVGVPWLAYAGAVMTEDVSYPVFCWTVLAIVRAVHAPSERRDVIALIALAFAFFARTQFVVLGLILVVSALVHDLTTAAAASGEAGAPAGAPRLPARLGAGLRLTLRRHRVLWCVCVLAVAAIAAMALAGSAAAILGNYVTPTHGNLLPAGTFAAGLEQLDGVVLGIGVAPLTLAAVWALATVVAPRDSAGRAFALVLIVTVAVMVVMLGSFQVRILDNSTTDRYLFYIVPLLFVAAVAWVVERRGSLPGLVLVGAGVGWMVISYTLHGMEGGFTITDPSFNFHRVLIGRGLELDSTLGLGHVDPRVLIAAAVSAFTLLAAALRRLPRRVALLATMVPVLAYGAVDAGYAMTGLASQNAGVTANHPQTLTWIDRLVPPGADVGLVLAPNGALQDTEWTWWQPYFWNKTVQRAFILPGGDNFSQGFVATMQQDLGHGVLTGLSGVDYLLKLTSDPRFQVWAPTVKDGDGVVLYHLVAGAPLVYGTRGVDEAGGLVAAEHPLVRVFGLAGAARTDQVTLTLQTEAPQRGCPCRLVDGARDPVPVPAVPAAFSVTRVVPAPPRGGHVDVPLTVRGAGGPAASAPLTLVSVRVLPR